VPPPPPTAAPATPACVRPPDGPVGPPSVLEHALSAAKHNKTEQRPVTDR
jgi:hypothetical protein